jgi:hypothetical protein
MKSEGYFSDVEQLLIEYLLNPAHERSWQAFPQSLRGLPRESRQMNTQEKV